MSDKYQALRDALKACPTSMDFDNAAMTQGVIGYEVSKWPLANFYSEANPATITALLADLDAAVSMLDEIESAIYMDDAGQIRFTRNFDESAFYSTLSQIKAAGREQA
jgi:hypothetical protein